MKCKFKAILFILVLFFHSSLSQTNFWQATSGPSGANVSSLTVDGSGNIYAGINDAGIYKSTNNGANWIESSTGLTIRKIFSLCTSNLGSIFAGTSNGGIVYQSTNGGSSWFSTLTLSADDGIYALAVNSAGVIFAGTSNLSNPKGMYRSTDNGTSWSQIINGLSNKNVISLTIGRNGYLYVGTDALLFRSTDNGNSWIQLYNGLPSTTYRALGIDSVGGVLAATADGVFRSTNDGQSWTLVNSTMPSNNTRAITVLPSGILCASTYNYGVYRSTDNGVTWLASNTGLTDHGCGGISCSSTGLLLLGNRSGAFRSTDAGITWTHINSGLRENHVRSLLRHWSGTVIAGCDRTMFYSSDNGDNWCQSSGLPTSDFYALTESPSGDVFCGTSSGYVYRSTDIGTNWTQANTGWIAIGVSALASNSLGHIFATNFGINRTTNNGTTWTGSNLAGSTSVYPNSLAIDPGGVIYTGTSNKGVFKSTDDGDTWTACGGNFTGSAVHSLVIDNDGGIFAGANGSVYYSTDQGITWELRSSHLSSNYNFLIALNKNKHIFAASSDSGIYRSKNHGRTWSKINTGLMSVSSFSLIVEPNGFIQVGTDNGVFRSLQSTTLFSLQRDSILFDTVKVGQSLIDSILVTNNGTELLNIDSISSSNPDFSITPQSVSLSVGQGMWFRITFTPKYFGVITGTVQFISNANTSPDALYLSGIGKAPFLHLGNRNYSIGRALLNTSRDSSIIFSNIGNDILNITNISITDSHFSLRPTSVQMLPGLVFLDTLQFTPTELGEISITAIITSNSLSSPDTMILQGIGCGIPNLQFSISRISIGKVPLGSFKDTVVTISNSGNDTLKIFSIQSSHSAFNVRCNNIPLAPGQSRFDTLRFTPITKDGVSGSIIYQSNSAKTKDTIYISGISDTTITGVITANQNLARYKLYQNYPNPFNPSTIITFEIPKDGLVIIKICNLIGQEVSLLLNKQLSQGEHNVIWNAEGFPSGIYFYRLQYGSITETKKLLYIR